MYGNVVSLSSVKIHCPYEERVPLESYYGDRREMNVVASESEGDLLEINVERKTCTEV
jgi:hypothetical protein